MPSSVIDVFNLRKTYRYHHKDPGLWGAIRSLMHREMLTTMAVDGISFTIHEGECVGFLGPNGAGKTTTLKMLCGLLYPTSGTATVLGYRPAERHQAFLEQIALVMGQKMMLWWDIPAMDTLLLHKELYSIPTLRFRQHVDELATMLQVTHLLRVQVRKLSLGERMKMELLVALVHQPAVLFLDEPTIGLDVVSRQRVRDFLSRLNRDHGTTVILTSHDLDDITAVCPRLLVIHHGRLAFDGAIGVLMEQAAPHKLLTIVFTAPVAPEVVSAALEGLHIRATDDPLRLTVAVPRAQVASAAARLLGLGTVADIGIEEVPIDEIIRDMFDA